MTTTASLTGPLAKIARAEELKEEFGTPFDEWVEQKPIGVKGRQDPGSDWFVMTFHILSALPIRLGVIFGDMLNNLRGALDHLIWQLALANNGTPSRGNAFPVVNDPSVWPSARSDSLKGVSDTCAEDVRAVQPFHEGRQAPFHWLALLNEVNNINKHRVIAPVLISSFAWEPTFELNRPAEAGDQVIDDPHPPPVGATLGDGQVLRRVKVTSRRDDLKIERIHKVIPGNFGLGWDMGVDVRGRELPDFIAFVRKAVTTFEPVFDR